jgi:hypothetical protein
VQEVDNWVRLPINKNEPSEGGVRGILLQLRLHFCLGWMMRLLSSSTIGGKSYESEENEMKSNGAGEKDIGRRKDRWARSKCIGISEVPTGRDREQIYQGGGTCSREG